MSDASTREINALARFLAPRKKSKLQVTKSLSFLILLANCKVDKALMVATRLRFVVMFTLVALFTLGEVAARISGAASPPQSQSIDTLPFFDPLRPRRLLPARRLMNFVTKHFADPLKEKFYAHMPFEHVDIHLQRATKLLEHTKLEMWMQQIFLRVRISKLGNTQFKDTMATSLMS